MSAPAQPSLWRRISARFWYAWGLSLCYSGNRTADRSFYRAGVDSFSRAATIWPEMAAAYYRRGLIRGRELGEYALAISDLERASALRPDWPEPYLQRGLFHRFQGRAEAAIPELRRYIELAAPGYWRDEAGRQLELVRVEAGEP
jgi:tetratricopeptide (TPR) repeat protein